MRSGWKGEGMDNWQTSELRMGLEECKGKGGRSGSRVDGKVMTEPGHKRGRGRVKKLWKKFNKIGTWEWWQPRGMIEVLRREIQEVNNMNKISFE